MKINKRECRKYASREFGGNKSSGLLYVKQIKYIVQTAIKNIGGQRILLIYVYTREQLVEGNKKPWLTMFQSRSEYVSLQFDPVSNSAAWRTASFENLKKCCYFSSECAFYSKKDEDRVTRFCKNPKKSGFSSLQALQQVYMDRKALKRRRMKERTVTRRMKDIRALPRDLKKWAVREIFPHYIFYNNKKRKGYCTACGREIKISRVKHNMEGECPRCQKKITYKSYGRKRYIFNRATGQVIQKAGNDLVIRVVKFQCSYPESNEPQVQYYESARTFIRWDAHKNITFNPYFYAVSNDGSILSQWRAGIRSCYIQYNYIFSADIRGYLYCRNLDKVLKKTPWQYSQLQEFYESSPMEFAAQHYFEQYIKYPFIEYFIKLKLYRLASDIIFNSQSYLLKKTAVNINGKSFEEILRLRKEYLPLLQRIDPGERQLRLIQVLIQERMRPDVTLMRWCTQNKIINAESIKVPLKYMTPYKLMRYIEEQCNRCEFPKRSYTNIKNELSDYKDYLCMCEGLEYDLTDDFILFPRDLAEAHAGVSELVDEDSARVCNNQIAKLADITQERYGYKFGDFMIVAPKSADEIVEEGQKLHHCVWQYVRKVAFHKSVILFLRRISEPNKPLCTLEIIDNELEQSKVYDNKNPSPEILRFIHQWEENVLKVPSMALKLAA